MKLNKEEALALAKVLHGHVGYGVAVSTSPFQDLLADLAERLDEYLLNGDEEVEEDEEEDFEDCDDETCDCHDEEDDEDEEAEDDDESEEEDSGEEDEEDDEEESEGEGSEDSEDEELEADCDVYGEELHELKAARGKDGALEFEEIEETGQVDLLLDGMTELEGVTHIRRFGKELHLRTDDGEWHEYEVAKFPRGWADALPLGELAEVV